MTIKYKNSLYGLDIDTLFVSNGHLMYAYGEPEFEILNVVVKENITKITVLRTQYLKNYDIYIDDKCGIYNLKLVTKELLNLDNNYIDEAISNGGSLETDRLTFKILSEECSEIEYVSGDRLENEDIESYMFAEAEDEEIVLLVNKVYY